MKVEIFKLCDFAQTDSVGKLTIVGIFDVIYAKEIPAAHGLCALAIEMRFERNEDGLKKIKISFIDADGKSIMPAIETQLVVRIAPNEVHAKLQAVVLIPQLTIPKFGEYSIDLVIDEQQVTSTSVFVRQAPTLAHPPTPPQTA
jgi:hypothetical protein